MKKTIPNQQILKTLLEYDPATGALTWLPRPPEMFTDPKQTNSWNARYAGKAAFDHLDNIGYCTSTLFRSRYRAHRVIWKWMTGHDPRVIDHINGNKSDNRWVNLREGETIDNMRNLALRRTNTSGFTGVSFNKKRGAWVAYINDRYQHLHLGTFSSREDACAARLMASRALGYHPNHGRAA